MITLLLVSIIVEFVFSKFVKYYWLESGTDWEREIVSMTLDDSGNTYILASDEHYGIGIPRPLIFKVSADGSVFWVRDLRYSSYQPNSVAIRGGGDSGVVVLLSILNNARCLLILLDENGNLDNIKMFGTKHSGGYDITVDEEDGSILVTGETNIKNTESDEDVFVFKFDRFLNITWGRFYPGDGYNYDVGKSIISIKNEEEGGYVVGGNINSAPLLGDGYNIGLIKLNNSGDIVWNQAFGTDSSDQIVDICESNFGYAFVGSSSGYSGTEDLVIGKMNNETGSLEWIKILGDPSLADYGTGIGCEDRPDGKSYVYVIGYTYHFVSGYMYMAKLDAFDGTVLSVIKYVDVGKIPQSILVTKDGSDDLLFGGTTDIEYEKDKYFFSRVPSSTIGCDDHYENITSLMSIISPALVSDTWPIQTLNYTIEEIPLDTYWTNNDTMDIFRWDNISICYPRWCGGISHDNRSYVCSGHGDCIANETCRCFYKWYQGDNIMSSSIICNITECDGIFSNESSNLICGGNGECNSPEECICKSVNFNASLYCKDCVIDYYGIECDVTTCDDIFSNETERVCNGHGNCTLTNVCQCSSGYCDETCFSPVCYGTCGNETEDVCSSHGECIGNPNNCTCDEGYDTLPNCSDYSCGPYGYKSEEVCNFGNGTCVGYNNCSCNIGYEGDECDQWKCNGVDFDDPSQVICSGHGLCVKSDVCACQENYTMNSEDCSVWTCYGGISNDTDDVCTGHGICKSHDNCTCQSSKYSGQRCQLWNCYGESALSDDVCGSHGTCLDDDQCYCKTGYSSSTVSGVCDEWYCGNFFRTDPNICNGRGDCTSSHLCDCKDEYEGNLCEMWSCGFEYTDPMTCSGNGECVSPDTCKCDTMYAGKTCSTNLYISTVVAPISVISALLLCLIGMGLFSCFCCCVCCACLCCSCVLFALSINVVIQKLDLKKFRKLRNFEVYLREQDIDDDISIAHLRINRDLFEIPFDEIKVEKIIGEGGSQSVVFQAVWRNQTVAFKCYKTRSVCTNQKDYDEFEREVEILSSLNHPSIIRFFGATLKEPRIGIVMEFCENGEILNYLKLFKHKHKKEYHINEKIRLMNEVASALDYCHSRKIIHRDLKCENCLLDQNLSCKLMDFGLSKVVNNMSLNQMMTRTVGTSIYMAPEVVLSNKYDEKCDIFSFGIMFYVVLTENSIPYGKNASRVEFRVSQSRDYRPDLSKIDEKLGNSKSLYWIKYIIKRCWQHSPSGRLPFEKTCGLFREHLANVDHTKGVGGMDEDDENEKRKIMKDFESDDKLSDDDDDSDSEEGKKLIKRLEKEIEELKERNDTFEKNMEKMKEKNKELKKELEKYKTENDV